MIYCDHISKKNKTKAVKRKLNTSVRNLVAHTLRSGDLVLEFSGLNRAMEGMKAHQKIQASRPGEYQSEVTVTHLVETDKFTLQVAGRMDGLFLYEDHAVIDEIKTTPREPHYFETNRNPLHWGQVKVYAYIYALQNNLETIDAQLTYYQLETGVIKEIRESFSLQELTQFFDHLVTRYLRWAETLHNWRLERDQSLKDLTFPFENYRPGQKRMALDIYYTIKHQDQLIVEAPTGIGKTMAAIFPAVKAMGDELTEKFFYLTAKTTGRTVAEKALRDLRGNGLKLKSLTLTAKDKVCFNPESACNGEECEYAKGFYDRINEAVEATFKEDALTRETIEKMALQFQVCPFEFSLEMALWVDGIICDYNYAFDPRVHLKRFFAEDNQEEGYTFLVDEANNLVDRSREMFSAELLKKSLLDLRKGVKKDLPGMYKVLGTINTRMVKMRKQCQEADKPLAEEKIPEEFIPLLRRFTRITERWLVRNQAAPYKQDVLTLYFQVSWFLKVSEFFDKRYSVCLEEVEDDFRIKLYCIDPSLLLSEAFLRCSAVVFFSATLSPVPYFRDVLGCSPSAKERLLPSPFPPGNLFLPVADRISTLYKYRDQTKMQLAEMINALVNGRPGNYLIFFPSYKYMTKIYDLFDVLNPQPELLIQRPGMSEEEREEFLEKFNADNLSEGKTLVGFAVMGGIFGEGIDLVGDRLSGAAIVGVGLPGICLERELIKDYFDNRDGSGFQYAYLFPGMNRVFQAAGRVIRTEEDRGVVLLIGSRFTSSQYRPLFPYHWTPVRVRDGNHLEEMLDDFLKAGPAATKQTLNFGKPKSTT